MSGTLCRTSRPTWRQIRTIFQTGRDFDMIHPLQLQLLIFTHLILDCPYPHILSMSFATEEKGRIALAEGAPEVNLHALILENHGLEIQIHPLMDRVIIATQDLDESLLYQPILRELPALVCKQQDYMDFMEQFLDCPVQLQVGILDMFYQPLDSAIGKSLIEPAKTLFILDVLEDFQVIHQLLSILMTNGHQYHDTHTAIPLFGSKFSHSCAPNIGYSSIASNDGALEYKLLRPIVQGEMVCFSYLSDLLETPTHERRQLLMETKSFRCCCERCLSPDYCRCMPCTSCTERVPCQYVDITEEVYWECHNCGMLESEPLAVVERQMSTTLDVINRKIEHRMDFDTLDTECSPSILRELVNECQDQLSETHYLTIKALRLLFTSVTALAYVQIKKMMMRGLSIATPRIHGLFRESVITGIQLVLAGECIAANCSGCQFPKESETNTIRPSLQPKHEPNYDRALVFRHICDNLFRLPVSWWPPQALTMALRYLPIMKARFGEKLLPLEVRINYVLNNLECTESGVYWDSYTGSKSPPQPPVETMDQGKNVQTTMTENVARGKSSNKKKNSKKKNRKK